MRGHMLDFSAERGSGAISGGDVQRSTFTADDFDKEGCHRV